MTDTAVADAHAEGDHEHHSHATDKDYVVVAVGLALLTAGEVALSYIDALKGLYLVIPLMVVMAIKFVIVASRFMHLKFDNTMLKRVFYAGLVLAFGVYLAALFTMHRFQKGDCPDGHSAKTSAACTATKS